LSDTALAWLACLQRGANDLHMVQLMPLPPHLLLHQNPDWFNLSGAGLPRLSSKKDHYMGVLLFQTYFRFDQVHQKRTIGGNVAGFYKPDVLFVLSLRCQCTNSDSIDLFEYCSTHKVAALKWNSNMVVEGI